MKGKKLNIHKFRNQHPLSKFILDFYCHSEKLGIEIDGEIHNTKRQKFYDEDRQEIIKDFGIKILRFKNNEVLQELERVKKEMLEVCEQK